MGAAGDAGSAPELGGAGGADDVVGGAGGADPPIGQVPAFIAIGHGGRRLLSCDDGRTWTETCATQGTSGQRCRVNDDNGDHEEWSSQGIAFGDGAFLALFGWFGGDSAHVLRTRDGRTWDHVFGAADTARGTWGTGIAFGSGAFVINAQRSGTHRTSNAGNDWVTKKFGDYPDPHRRTVVFIPYKGGRFLSYGDENRVTWSDDGGITWKEGKTNCPYLRHLAWGANVLVSSDFEGRCLSEDGGLTFKRQEEYVGAGGLVWTGEGFYLSRVHSGEAFVSDDGRSWQRIKVASPGDNQRWPAVLAVQPSGTMVGVAANGDSFFRSVDGGRTWRFASGTTGNNVTAAAFGYVAPTGDCPRP